MNQPDKPNPLQTDNRPGNSPIPIKEQLQQRLLDQYDLQQLFKVSRGTIYNWCRQGLLSFTRLGGKKYFDARDVEEMLQQNKQRYEPGKGEKK